MTDIQQIIKSLEKDFGDLRTLNEADDFDIIPTGLKSLDNILGVGGIPRGGFIELYGSESVGKSILSLLIMAQAQKLGLQTAYIDAERAMSKSLAKTVGLKLEDVIYYQPAYGEEAIDFILEIVNHGVKLIVVDSVTSLIPKDESEANMEQQSIGLQARMMSRAARMLLGPISKNNNNVAIIWINQLRSDIMKFGFGPKVVTSGGKALKYYSLLRIKLARIAWLSRGQEKTGMRLKAVIEKNKLGIPQLSTEFDFRWKEGQAGFSLDEDALNLLEKQAKIKKIAQTYYLGDEKLGTKDKAIALLKEKKML